MTLTKREIAILCYGVITGQVGGGIISVDVGNFHFKARCYELGFTQSEFHELGIELNQYGKKLEEISKTGVK